MRRALVLLFLGAGRLAADDAAGRELAADRHIVAGPEQGATFVIYNYDAPGEGFNDPTLVAPVPGNPGTTLGQQRLSVFLAAASTWGRHLMSEIAIEVDARFDELACSDSEADLGAAFPVTVHRDFPGAPQPATWYVEALANSRAGEDLLFQISDIGATFSSTIDAGDPGCIGGQSWWYGIGVPAPADTIGLFTTLLHELAHGLGFLSLHDRTTGAKFLGFDDAYLRLLYDESSAEGWSTMTDAERLASQVNSGSLVWIGPEVTATLAGFDSGVSTAGFLRVYAPNPVQIGRSISHWDLGVSPIDLMAPVVTTTSRDYVAYRAMADLGWRLAVVFKDSFESGDDDFWSVAQP